MTRTGIRTGVTFALFDSSALIDNLLSLLISIDSPGEASLSIVFFEYFPANTARSSKKKRAASG